MPDGEEEERGGLRHVLVTQELEALEDVPGGENIYHYFQIKQFEIVIDYQ